MNHIEKEKTKKIKELTNKNIDLEKSKMLPIKPEREHLHKSAVKNKKVIKSKRKNF